MKARMPVAADPYKVKDKILNDAAKGDKLATQTLKLIKDELRAEIYEAELKNITVQWVAVIMACLELSQEWKGQRLRRFLNDLKSYVSLMEMGVCGKAWSGCDCYERLKSKYSIDLLKELECWFEEGREK